MKTRLNSIIMILLWVAASLVPAPARAQTPPTWTGQIAYIGGDGNVWVLHSESSQPLQVTSDASEQIRYYSPLFSPAGDLLAYCRNELGGAGGSQLYLARTASWQPIQLVDDVFCQGLPQLGFDWSPDGATIAYTRSFVYGPQADGSQWSKYHGIWSVDVASGQSTELITPPGTNPLVYPRWSPDGRWIRLYELVYMEGLGVLRTWNRDNGALYNWLEVGNDMFPGSSDWSPDSVRLVFDQVTYVGFPGAGLYTALPDSSDLLQLFVNPSQGVMRPTWSPDGANVAFQLRTYEENERTGIGLISPNGGNFREIYQTQANLEIQDWSPDGSQLLFVSDDGGQANLYIYDLTSATQFPVVTGSGWQASWAPIPETGQPQAPSGAVEIEGFRISGGSLLAYLGENYQLWLYDPANGSRGQLSEPLSATSFWKSPSGMRLIYADRLLDLSFQEDSSLIVQEIRLPANPSGDEIHWAPGESRLAYRDALGRVWLVQAGSSFVEVPGATDIPNWSFDGRFISYCTEGNRLWVVGGGISLREVASPVDCGGAWSSSQGSLAYTLKGSAGAASNQVYVYDPERSKSSLVMDGASLIGWSPDGEVLGMRQDAKSGGTSFTYFAAKPLKGKPLEVGDFNQTQPGNQGWADAGEAYILGPYQIDKNLRSSERVAPAVYDAAREGQILLLGEQAGNQHELACLNMESDQTSSLVSVDLSAVPTAEEPGVWAQLSPDGNWASSNNYAPDGYRYLLTRCDRNRQAALQSSRDAAGDAFSTDSRWYAQRLPGESRGGLLLLYNLETLERESLPALSSSPAEWIQPPANALPETYILAGKVISEDGTSQASVNILVDGQPAATTNPDGSFEVSGLAPGEHTVSALKSGLVFSPESQTFNVPGESPEIIFEAIPEGAPGVIGTPGVEGTQQAIAKPVVLTPTSAGADTPTAPPVTGGGSTSLTQGTLWTYVCGSLVVIFLLVVLIVRLSQRRKRQAQPVEEALPEAPEPSAQPVAKTALDPEVNTQLKQGVDQVKANQNAAGRETLKKVLAQAPDNAIAWLWSGMAATRMQDWHAAEHSFQQAKKLGHPKADDALRWLAEERKKGG
jgi:Tol biopolymer transport system component